MDALVLKGFLPVSVWRSSVALTAEWGARSLTSRCSASASKGRRERAMAHETRGACGWHARWKVTARGLTAHVWCSFFAGLLGKEGTGGVLQLISDSLKRAAPLIKGRVRKVNGRWHPPSLYLHSGISKRCKDWFRYLIMSEKHWFGFQILH